MSKNNIEHKGTIERIEGDLIYVKIITQSACSACHAKSVCNIWEIKEKIIEVKRSSNNEYHVGDDVSVVLTQNLGTKAVFLGYFIPFLLLMLTLILSLSLFKKEWLAGLLSLAVLLPYYFGLYLYRDKLKATFDFKLIKRL
ncbi:MAG: SoxR reducing system RseC family protein [Bacteroidales bacterium]|nr:SoxR reducing system RseC family protein [Bacteroidales bacterium]